MHAHIYFNTLNVKCYRGNAVKAAHKRVKRTEETQCVVQNTSQACAFVHKSQLDYGCRNYTQLRKKQKYEKCFDMLLLSKF